MSRLSVCSSCELYLHKVTEFKFLPLQVSELGSCFMQIKSTCSSLMFDVAIRPRAYRQKYWNRPSSRLCNADRHLIEKVPMSCKGHIWFVGKKYFMSTQLNSRNWHETKHSWFFFQLSLFFLACIPNFVSRRPSTGFGMQLCGQPWRITTSAQNLCEMATSTVLLNILVS